MSALPKHADLYLDGLARDRRLSSHSLAAYRRDLSLYATFLERSAIADPAVIGTRELSEFPAWIRSLRTAAGRPYAAATVTRTLVAVRGFHRHLVVQGLADKDPAGALTAPAPRRRQRVALGPRQAAALLGAPEGCEPVGLRDRALLQLLYATGLRITEVLSLNVTDVDLAASTVTCTGRGARQRVLSLGGDAREAVEAWLAHGRPALVPSDAALLVNRRGGRLSRQGGWKIIKRHAEAAGLGQMVSPNTLRHAYAAQLLAGGVDVRTVASLLGHATVSSTRAYTPPSPSPRDAAPPPAVEPPSKGPTS